MAGIVQHQDHNVSPASYRHLAGYEMLVTSIFFTVQGEGPYAGRPAIFVRLAGCNRGRKDDMGCAFCDTAFYFGQGQVMTFKEISKRCSELGFSLLMQSEGAAPLIVITGGEPMIQDNLTGLLGALRQDGFRSIQIESNGDRIAAGFTKAMADLIVSPKTVGGKYRMISPFVREQVMAYKFVVSADPLSPYHSVPDWARTLNAPVYVSPLAVYLAEHSPRQAVSAWNRTLVDQQATSMNYGHAARIAMAEGYTVSIQQHLFCAVE